MRTRKFFFMFASTRCLFRFLLIAPFFSSVTTFTGVTNNCINFFPCSMEFQIICEKNICSLKCTRNWCCCIASVNVLKMLKTTSNKATCWPVKIYFRVLSRSSRGKHLFVCIRRVLVQLSLASNFFPDIIYDLLNVFEILLYYRAQRITIYWQSHRNLNMFSYIL